MTTRPHKVHTQLGRAAVQIFAANDRMNQILIDHLDPTAWRAKPPGKVRSIAAIFTHMHNIRCKWVRLTAPHLKVPRQLHRTQCTPQQARKGLAESAARCAEMLAEALGAGGGRVEQFRRDGWAGLGRLAWKCCATCFLTKPTIADRCVCLRISWDYRCRKRWRTGSGIGKSCGKSAGRLAAAATILKGVYENPMSWACPRCVRTFRQINQRHACGVGSAATLLKGRPAALTECAARGDSSQSQGRHTVLRQNREARLTCHSCPHRRGPTHDHFFGVKRSSSP